MRGMARLTSALVPVVVTIAAAAPTVAASVLSPAGVGFRSGLLMGRTDLTDDASVHGRLFIRYAIRSHLVVEAGAGYGRLSGAVHATDLAMADARVLVGPRSATAWRPFAFGGVGAARHDIDTLPAGAPDRERIAWSAILPAGVGIQTTLTDRVSFELSTGYTYSLRDDLDGTSLEKGNDGFWLAQAGLTISTGGKAVEITESHVPARRFDAETSVRRLSRADRVEPPTHRGADRDGDGLGDLDETTVHFTNPLMMDSDGDGLDDREEVEVHGTNPNRRDSDEDGIDDGREIERGRNPLIADGPGRRTASGSKSENLGPGQPGFAFETIFFPTGGAKLTPENEAYLDRVADYLIKHEKAELELRGYSDSVGSWSVNLRLSGVRCGVVRDHLVARGVENWRLTLEAFGEADPIASNSTSRGRAMNRRVELIPIR